MEILHLIELFLKGEKDYAYGVELYSKIGTSNSLKKLFASGEDDYSREKLTAELETFANSLKANTVKNKFQSFTAPKKKPIDISILPANLRAEHAKLGPIIREMASLHAKLELFSSDELRYEAAEKIIELAKARRIIFTRLDYFSENGKDHPMFVSQPSEEPVSEPVLDFASALKKIKLLRSQRTKLKDRPDRYDDYVRICNEITILTPIIKAKK